MWSRLDALVSPSQPEIHDPSVPQVELQVQGGLELQLTAAVQSSTEALAALVVHNRQIN